MVLAKEQLNIHKGIIPCSQISAEIKYFNTLDSE
jgi:hypothetical protein